MREDTSYHLQVVCRLPWWDSSAHEVKYSFCRVNAYTSGYAPRSYYPWHAAHFAPGDVICGFVEASSRKGYKSAQFISWDRLDWDWGHQMRPWFLPRS